MARYSEPELGFAAPSLDLLPCFKPLLLGDYLGFHIGLDAGQYHIIRRRAFGKLLCKPGLDRLYAFAFRAFGFTLAVITASASTAASTTATRKIRQRYGKPADTAYAAARSAARRP